MNEVESSRTAVPVPVHRIRRMSGRDPEELHRAATPLELLFDLTFVIGFGIAASEFAHQLAEDHVGVGLAAFVFATFAICWAWINFSWFASAYDTDDWIYRLMTMLQMVGVIILSLGFPAMFASIAEGHHVDNRVMVAGYVVMRIALVAQWLRAAKQDPQRRSACLTYATVVTVAQFGWIAMILVSTSVATTYLWAAVLVGFEMFGPWLAERRMGGTPWHAHHISERYSLLTIIALGEGVVGTVASLSAVVGSQGWSVDAVLVAVAGTGLTFGMWWVYFVVPQSQLLNARRELSFRFGYLHLVVFGVDRGNRGRVACRRLLHRTPLEAQLGGYRAVGGDTGGDLHRGGVSALPVVGADAGRVSSATRSCSPPWFWSPRCFSPTAAIRWPTACSSSCWHRPSPSSVTNCSATGTPRRPLRSV